MCCRYLLHGGGRRRRDTCELLVYGAQCDAPRIDAALASGGHVRLLFPAAPGEAQTVEEAFAEALTWWQQQQQQRQPPPPPPPLQIPPPTPEDGGEATGMPAIDPPALTIIVPDGSWECARALVRALLQSAGKEGGARRPHNHLRCIALDEARVRRHVSPLIDALHCGAGRGRISTLEACAQCLAEAREAAPSWGVPERVAEDARGLLQPLLEHVATLLPADGMEAAADEAEAGGRRMGDVSERSGAAGGGAAGGGTEPPASLLAAWATALQAAAKAATARCEATGRTTTHAFGLRRCVVCRAALATPHHMRRHLEGRRHCEVVARRHLQRAQPAAATDVAASAEAAAAVFEELSSAPLRASLAEPPDVALAALQRAFAAAGAAAAPARRPHGRPGPPPSCTAPCYVHTARVAE